MYQVTIVCVAQNGEFKALYIHNANKDKIDRALKENDIYCLEYVLEHYVAVGVRDFQLYATQDELIQFRSKWEISF